MPIGNEKFVDNPENSDIISSMERPIEQAHPADIIWGRELNHRQKEILDNLPNRGSRYVARKRDVSMLDLSALTANTGDEFAMFTRKGERLIVRGNKVGVPLSVDDLKNLRTNGYRWSGHTHVGDRDVNLVSSEGDKLALKTMKQQNSVIYNAAGKHRLIYPKDGN